MVNVHIRYIGWAIAVGHVAMVSQGLLVPAKSCNKAYFWWMQLQSKLMAGVFLGRSIC